MDVNFWHEKWEKNQIAFHEGNANQFLVKYFKELSLPKGSRIFLPLCGKTRDIAWLLSNDYCVVGAELSEIAIQQLFEELEIQPKIAEIGKLKHYSADGIDIFVGNIFDLSSETLGQVDAIYDRAALVALPNPMRHQYTNHLMQISNKAPQLLICFEYDQTVIDGPPFSITDEEVHEHYADEYDVHFLEKIDVPGGLKGKCPANESVWILK